MAERKTPEEIEDLKAQWIADGCWDIEDTEGFEAHYAELKEFSDGVRAKQDAKDAAAHEAAIADVERRSGITGNRKLAEYFLGLEYRIKSAARYADRLSERIDDNMECRSTSAWRRRHA